MTRRGNVMLGCAAVLLSAVLLVTAHQTLVRGGTSCPLAEPSPVALEAQRQRAMGPLTTTTAGVAPVSDTSLGESRRRFVAVEERNGARCKVDPAGATVRCENERSEVLARFDPADRLVALDRVQYGLSAEDGGRVLADMLADARLHLGEPARLWGERSAVYLGSPLRQAGYEYRFADVAIDVTATHLGRDGVVLRQQHRAVPRATKGS